VIGWCSRRMAEQGGGGDGVGANSRVHADPTCVMGPDPMVAVQIHNGLLFPSCRPLSRGLRVSWCAMCQSAEVPGEWSSRAACRGADQDPFFPTVEDSSHVNERYTYASARAICKTCAVLDDCRSFALAHEPGGGMWGGLTPRQRKEARRQTGSVVS
jgi:WhiB family redox-sensing transcriptional regulator